MAGRGGTCFEAAFFWLKEATTRGVITPTLSRETGASRVASEGQLDLAFVDQLVKLKVDGVVYFTDGYALPPTTPPPCPVMWLLTPHGSDHRVAEWAHTTTIVRLSKASDGLEG